MINIIVPIKEVISRKMYIQDSVNFAEARATKPNEAIANPKRLKVSLLKSSNIVNSSQNYQDWQILKSADSLKNYTTHTDGNEISTHEVAVAPLVPSLRSVGKHRFTGKSIHFVQSPLEINDFPKSSNEDFCKSLIMWLRPNLIFYSNSEDRL